MLIKVKLYQPKSDPRDNPIGVANKTVYNWFHPEDIRVVSDHVSIENTCIFLHAGMGQRVHADMPAEELVCLVNNGAQKIEIH